jgi:glycosyltransferase involved in cell wall biosynthesis
MHKLPRRLLVLGLCRNCCETLPALLTSFAEVSRSAALDLQVYLGENGSTDATRAILAQTAANSTWLHLIDTSFMSQIPERLARMAAGREVLKKCLPPARPGDVVLVADADLELAKPLDADLLLAAIGELDQEMTNGVCSYSQPLHYDILALRDTAQSVSPALESYLAGLGSRSFGARLLRFPRRLQNLNRVIRVQRQIGVASGRSFVSAFNGMCLYHRPLYDAFSYLSPQIECEHVTLHLAMHDKTGGMIRVSHHLGVKAPAEHIASLAGAIWRRVLASFNRSEHR